MRKITLLMLLVSATFASMAQSADEIIAKILKANEKYNTVSCQFTQTKKMAMMDKEVVNSGDLYFNRADKLCMKYTNPEGNLLLITGESLLIISGDRRNDFNTKNNVQMRTLKNTLLMSIAGDVNAVAAENATKAEFSQSADYYIFTMQKEKGSKSKMTKMVLSYSKKDLTLCSLVMEENNGNVTTYDTKSKVFNPNINESVYAKPVKKPNQKEK
ncbi:MAG: outer membrane lipoprotein carrier protein LolA [Salinivirgaceae bacterium]|nr:outer membrane lipoprotein carrier protein LolA [Salinivirgaceae bacterium]